MTIKVLAFAGSPRRNGNSETLLDWVLASMGGEPDVAIEKVPLTEANINPCRGCNACEKLNKCVQRDGMDIYHDKIVACGLYRPFTSPIFCMGLASQVKALVDRAQVFTPGNTSSDYPSYRPNGKVSGSGCSSRPQDRTGVMYSMPRFLRQMLLPCHRYKGRRPRLPDDKRSR